MSKKSILVVGGTRGIGRACVNRLVQTDCEIYSISRSPAEETEATNISYIQANACTDDLSFLPNQLDGLVYCPGSINLKPLKSLSLDDFSADYEVNVLGFVRILKQCIPALKRSGQASVVTFSTVAVAQGMNYHSSVAASKGAVEALTRSLAAEFSNAGIRFNSIALSLVDTSLASKLIQTKERRDQIASRHPLQRIGDPEEVAALVSYLLGPESTWMTGQIIGLDGGLSVVKAMS